MKRTIATVLALIMVLALCACGGSTTAAPAAAPATETAAAPATETAAAPATETAAAPAADAGYEYPEMTLILASTFNDVHPVGQASLIFADLMKERSGGKITVDVYGGSLLGGDRDIIESEQLGTIDLIVSGPALANFFPGYEIMNMPFLFESTEHAYRALDGDFGHALLGELESIGLVGIGWMDNGFYDCMQSKYDHVESWEQLTGLNIRTVESAGYLSGWGAIGVNAVPMAATEVYTAMETGAVDGICLSKGGIEMLGVYQANQKCYTNLTMYMGALPVIASKILWDSYPAEVQALIQECMDEACLQEREIRVENEKRVVGVFEEAGIVVEDMDPVARNEWAEKVREAVYPQYPDICTEEYLAYIASYK